VSITAIVIIVAAIALIAVIVTRSGGPRVTQIDRTIRKDKDGSDA
jgi:multisubunit Na+/H+ antiporter MnhC subunit